jgi:hypothetical protein
MSAGNYNIAIEQNATFSAVFTWTAGPNVPVPPVGSAPLPVDLTGYTAMLQIRPYALSTTVLYDASALLVLGGVNGTITLVIPASVTQGFTWWNGVYDLLMVNPSGFVTRLLQGSVTVSPGVTP